MHNLPPVEQKRAKHRSKHSKHKSNSKSLDIDHAPPRDRSCSESGTIRPAGVFLAGIQEGAEPLGRGLVVCRPAAANERSALLAFGVRAAAHHVFDGVVAEIGLLSRGAATSGSGTRAGAGAAGDGRIVAGVSEPKNCELLVGMAAQDRQTWREGASDLDD